MLTIRPFFQTMRGRPKRRFSASTLRAARCNARSARVTNAGVASRFLLFVSFPSLSMRQHLPRFRPAGEFFYLPLTSAISRSVSRKSVAPTMPPSWSGCQAMKIDCHRKAHDFSPRTAFNVFKRAAMKKLMHLLEPQEIRRKTQLDAAGFIQLRELFCIQRPFETTQVVLELRPRARTKDRNHAAPRAQPVER